MTGCLHVGGASFIYVGTGLRTYIWPTIDHVSVLAIYIIFRGNYCIRCTKNGWGTRHYLQWPAMVSVDVAVVLPASLATAGAATHLINSSLAEMNTAALAPALAQPPTAACLPRSRPRRRPERLVFPAVLKQTSFSDSTLKHECMNDGSSAAENIFYFPLVRNNSDLSLGHECDPSPAVISNAL